jgi:putative transposase
MNEQTHPTQEQDLINLILDSGIGDAAPRIMELVINAAMIVERNSHLHALPHQRCEERTGHANGFKPRTFNTSMGKLKLSMPQVRNCEDPFHSSLLSKGSRSERALKASIAEMYIQGVSTRKVTKILETMCGLSITSNQVSKLTAELDDEFEKWRCRPLPEIRYLILDATYKKVRRAGAVRDCAVLIITGVRRDNGKRMILSTSCALSEAEVHWRKVLQDVRERGIGIPDLVTSDAHEGLKAALKFTLNATPWQRCQFHLQQNAQKYVPKVSMKKEVASDIRRIFDCKELSHAEIALEDAINKYAKSAPELSGWLEDNISEGLTILTLPEEDRKRLRTSNMCENVNSQISRRTRVVGLFPNEASLLRLVTAVLMEISEGWETGKVYLKPST